MSFISAEKGWRCRSELGEAHPESFLENEFE